MKTENIEITELSWILPGRVAIDDGSLVSLGEHRTRVDLRRDRIRLPALLDGFAALAEAPDARVSAYAGRHGMLGLCPHGLGRHEWTDVRSDPARFRWCRRGREPLALWRDLAGATTGAIALAAELHAGREASRGHVAALAPFLALWRELPERTVRELGGKPGYERPAAETPGDDPRRALTAFLDAWMSNSRIAPAMVWGRGLPQVRLVPREPRLGLLAALGIALLGRVTRSVRPDFCHACAAPLTRRARRGARSFCKRAACQRAKRNLHQAEYRARRRDW
jgi:hypothetical protein